ncbi:CoB--CoM heterodisulfide reductase iron-sulfur subunit B family protein [Desulfobacterium sp. N47]|uniref:CoB--CoM heterodisulfide reductase iron-sulfur subunit B family protein n=1 Tax=Desulfobacterium sp. N47 TaxID=3115210 RepID=UPI003F4A7519
MMKFALFLGCNIPVRVSQYELSARAVLDKLGVEVVDIREFKCCGNPIRNTDNRTFVLMAARNLALAEKQGLDMMVLCKCCFGSLKKAVHLMKQNSGLKEEVNAFLAEEGLKYSGTLKVKHFLSVLYHDIGISTLKEKVSRTFKSIKIAPHYGCHALRPSDITEFDDPVAPVLFDELVSATGAQSIDWPLKLECCGAPLLGINDRLSMDLTGKKLADAKRAGADYLCVACPFCQMQFGRVQKMMTASNDINNCLLSILYPQLIGLAMGIGGNALGINMNIPDISSIESFLL